MRRFAYLAAFVFVLASAPRAVAGTVLVGDVHVERTSSALKTQYARAFSFKAVASGTSTAMDVWVEPRNDARFIQLGLYSNRSGRPAKLLDKGSTSSVIKNAWNRVTLTGAKVTQGTKYWLAILGKGSVGYANRSSHQCVAVRSSSKRATLPAKFVSKRGSDNRCASIYATTGTLLSAGWWPAWEQVPFSTIPWSALTQLIMFSDTTATTAPFLNTTIHGMTAAMQRQFVPLVHHHGDTAILSIGGSDDQGWSTACDPANRSTFISSVIGQMRRYGYDGVELDIEQGSWIGGAGFNDCVRGFHAALKATTTNAGRAPILSLDEDPSWESPDIPAVAQYLDQINLMGYNDTCVNGCAQVSHSLSTLTSHGVPASKLVDGIGLDPGMPDATNPSDCGAKAKYLSSSTTVKGVAEWSVQDDFLNNDGKGPCFNALAPYVR